MRHKHTKEDIERMNERVRTGHYKGGPAEKTCKRKGCCKK